MPDPNDVYTIADHVTLWIAADGGSIHIKTREPYGDPVELTEEDARALADVLIRLAERIS